MDYDQNPIQVFTQYTYEEMKAFQKFHTRKPRRNAIILLCVAAVMVAVNFIATAVTGTPIVDTFKMFLPSILLFAALFAFLLGAFSGLFYTKKQHGAATKLMQNGQWFHFFNRDYAVGHETQDYIGQGRFAYNILEKVCETEEAVYLYIGKRQAHIVSKTGFSNGSPDELRALLTHHVPPMQYHTR